MYLILLFLGALPAWAQPQQVTIRDINAIPQSNIDQLNALGTSVTVTDLEANGGALIFGDLLGAEVQIQAVVLSDPLNSGLASAGADGLPGRVHFFVRDIAANDLGVDGMTIQIVDGAWQDHGVGDLAVGDVIEVVGTVSPFSTIMQIAPLSITPLGRYDDGVNYNLPDSILDPVTITTADANADAGPSTVLVNWDNLASLRDQYVRIEGATVWDRDVTTDRPNWTISTDGGQTFLTFYDTSLRYRNDRDGFYDETVFNVRTDDYVPPQPGDVVTVEAFLVFNRDDPFARAGSPNVILNFNPWTDADVTDALPVELTVTPNDAPIIVPVGGGRFTYDATATNATDTALDLDVWVTIEGPGISRTLGPRAVSVSAGGIVGATLTQRVPPGAPAGTYTQTLNVGTFPIADASDSFTWEKDGGAAIAERGGQDWASNLDVAFGEAAAEVPASYALGQNFPNPFNPTTLIGYEMPEAGQVTVRVFNTLGQEVAVLVDGYREAGRHEVRFDARDLSAGVYLYVLEAGSHRSMKQMVLLK